MDVSKISFMGEDRSLSFFLNEYDTYNVHICRLNIRQKNNVRIIASGLPYLYIYVQHSTENGKAKCY